MAIPSRFTKVKIAAGYTLLLVVLLLSLLFVHREMEKLSDTDDVQSLQTDSLLLLLKRKMKIPSGCFRSLMKRTRV